MTIPIDGSILYYVYMLVGVDPAACSQFVSDFMPVAAVSVVLLILLGCSLMFKAFRSLMRW